jgi:hypothetical protein
MLRTLQLVNNSNDIHELTKVENDKETSYIFNDLLY